MKNYTIGDIHKLHTEASARNDIKTLKKCEALYSQILDQEPDNWMPLFLMSGIFLQTGRNGMAIALLNRAVQIKPDCAEAWNNLGTAYRRQFKDDKAEAALTRCVELKPEDSDAWNNLGTIHINEGTAVKGIPLFEKALALNPDNIHAHWNYALALLELGRYEQGFREYAWGLKSADRLHRTYGAPDWDGKPIDTLVVYGEQGIGDEIMFASIIPEVVKGVGELIFDCHPRLVNLFERSFGVKCHGTRKEQITEWAGDVDIDASCPIGGLAEFYRHGVDDFPREPYLIADDDLTDKMMNRLADLPAGMNIGIGWKGGKHKTRTSMRTTGLEALLPILQTRGVNFISLQYTPETQAEIDAFHVDHPEITIHHWPEVVQAVDYDETAALVSALDLVIAVNTSVVHLCGALGVPCWTMTPVRKAWRYYSPDGKDGEQMTWYGTVKQYQQTTDGEWTSVVENIAADLRDQAMPLKLVGAQS